MAFILLPLFHLKGQADYNWWNSKHDWDGTTHWTQYMILSPGYLGPNALPIPQMYTGKIPGGHTFEFGTEGHFSRGDQTGNIYLDYKLPLFTERAAINITYRPLEIYRTDTVTRDERRSREIDPSGVSLGDIYFSTYIQMLQGHAILPDIMLSANIKTASGTNLDGARHTDTPGYWFDVTAGKTFSLQYRPLRHLRIFGKAGFYVYQTFEINHYQNDAFLYGGGLEVGMIRMLIQHQLTGYTGYFYNGDRPLVYRFIVRNVKESGVSYRLMFQQGLNDYSYSTLRLSLVLNLDRQSQPNP
ncbi:MAG: hypothetical protein K9G38_03175 [Bacteroidales bacterium]|nr:hypothetical protein [Bacteroidales bacterium]